MNGCWNCGLVAESYPLRKHVATTLCGVRQAHRWLRFHERAAPAAFRSPVSLAPPPLALIRLLWTLHAPAYSTGGFRFPFIIIASGAFHTTCRDLRLANSLTRPKNYNYSVFFTRRCQKHLFKNFIFLMILFSKEAVN